MAVELEAGLFGQHESEFKFDDGESLNCREIFLPLSVSENNRQTIRHGRVLINTTEYNRYLTEAVRLLRKGSLPMYECNVFLANVVYFPDRKIRDPQNYEKGLFDAFSFSRFDRGMTSTVWTEKPLSERTKGFVYNDDSQVSMHMTYRMILKGYAFHYCIVTEMVNALNVLKHAKEIFGHEHLMKVAEDMTRYNNKAIQGDSEL